MFEIKCLFSSSYSEAILIFMVTWEILPEIPITLLKVYVIELCTYLLEVQCKALEDQKLLFNMNQIYC